METLKDLRSWASHIGKFSSVGNIEEIYGTVFCQTEEDADYGEILFRFYTDANSYTINAYCRPSYNDKGDPVSFNSYLGCVASARKPRAGEDWTRGNDLADGPLTHETWTKILGDILSYELVKVHKKNTTKETIDEIVNNAVGPAEYIPPRE
jgi:hypothetical protein